MVILIALGFQGCGSSADSNNNNNDPSLTSSTETTTAAETDTKTATETKTSQASLSGTYSFITKSIPFTCTDGGEGSIEKIARNFTVTVTGNEIKITSTKSKGTTKAAGSGINITAVSGYSGLVEKSRAFSATQTASGSHSTYGKLTFSYSIVGKLTSSGWSGTYKYSMLLNEQLLTCNYKTTFSGEKQ